MTRPVAHPVVHLELRTPNPPRACAFYTELFGWRAETVSFPSGSYLALALGDVIQGGAVENDDPAGSRWVPYVEVPDVAEATERARGLGATVTLGPREGPAGWRSSVVVPAGAEVALWQPKL